MAELHQAGKIRAISVSNLSAEQMLSFAPERRYARHSRRIISAYGEKRVFFGMLATKGRRHHGGVRRDRTFHWGAAQCAALIAPYGLSIAGVGGSRRNLVGPSS
ncbi:MAG TPA: hypothetical protein VKF35_13795 [Hyphomicrobiaceae bacterium]|nr:hypothetical protein [Hyphomicrobiaceae bacterium]